MNFVRSDDTRPKILFYFTLSAMLLCCRAHPHEKMKNNVGVHITPLKSTNLSPATDLIPGDFHITNKRLDFYVKGILDLETGLSEILKNWTALITSKSRMLVESYQESGRILHLQFSGEPHHTFIDEIAFFFQVKDQRWPVHFYTVKIQDKQVKFYGEVKGIEHLRSVMTIAVFDDDNYITSRISVANHSKQRIDISPGITLRLPDTSKNYLPLSGLRNGSRLPWIYWKDEDAYVGWSSRGLFATIQEGPIEGHRMITLVLDEVQLEPEQELSLDSHFILMKGSDKEWMREIDGLEKMGSGLEHH